MKICSARSESGYIYAEQIQDPDPFIQNISRIRIHLFEEHIQDPDPFIQNISRIRIHLCRTYPGSGSIYTEHIQDSDPFMQNISRIRIHLCRTYPRSGFLSKWDPIRTSLYLFLIRLFLKRYVFSLFLSIEFQLREKYFQC